MRLLEVWFSCMRIRIVLFFLSLVLYQRQTLSIIFCSGGRKHQRFRSDCLFSIWLHLKDKKLMNLLNNGGIFSVILNWKRWMIKREIHVYACWIESTRNFPCHYFNFESFNMSAKWIFMYYVKVFPGEKSNINNEKEYFFPSVL